MKVLQEELGKALCAQEVATYLGMDVKFVRKNYQSLGGVRLGRHYRFFERRLINAISNEEREIQSPSAEDNRGRSGTPEGKYIPDQEGCVELGSGNADKAYKRMEREDRHGLLG